MDEILASIRRMIADDNSGKPAPTASEPMRPAGAAKPPAAAPAMRTAAPSAFPDHPARVSAPSAQVTPTMNAFDSSETRFGKRTPAAEAHASTTPPALTSAGASHMPGSNKDVRTAAPMRPGPNNNDAPATGQPQLLSPATTAVVGSAFDALAQTVAVQSPRTLEDIVRDMLRPVLKTWLDDNLPQLVERLVRAEIERLSRGR